MVFPLSPVDFPLHPSPGAEVKASVRDPLLASITGLHLISKNVGSSRSPYRGLGDHFADPVLVGESPTLFASSPVLRRRTNYKPMPNIIAIANA
jgi:hypothetical protein